MPEDTVDKTEDRLDILFKYQYALQDRLGTWDKIKDNPAMKQQWFNQLFLALQEEIVEAMRETGYKNPDLVPFGWKKTQVGDPDKLKTELVDILFFWMATCITADFKPAEIFDRYLTKLGINTARQDTGY